MTSLLGVVTGVTEHISNHNWLHPAVMKHSTTGFSETQFISLVLSHSSVMWMGGFNWLHVSTWTNEFSWLITVYLGSCLKIWNICSSVWITIVNLTGNSWFLMLNFWWIANAFNVISHVAPSLVCNSKLKNKTVLKQTVKSSLWKESYVLSHVRKMSII